MYRLNPKGQQEGLQVSCNILSYFGVKYTNKHVAYLLEDHVEYPSLLSLHDTLSEYGIVSTAIRKGEFSYEDVETPYISSIQQEDWPTASFTVVSQADNNLVTYIDPITGNKKTISLADFEKIDKGILLLLDGDAAKDESNYLLNRKRERTTKVIGGLSILLVGLFLLIPLVYPLSAWRFEGVRRISLAFSITGFVGLVTSILLLWYKIDKHTPFLKEVCGGGGGKVNCSAVLDSKGSTFLGISWSSWGFAYFASLFFTHVLYPGQVGFLTIWSINSVAAALYIPYSAYYQAKVVKQWCLLCVSVQAVLLLNLLFSALHLLSISEFAWDGFAISIMVLLGSAFLLLTHYAVPLLKQARDSKDYEKKWKRLRYHPDIFKALLDKSDKATVPVDGLGIVVGNPTASREIIKVCNPYCGPCSKAHLKLEEVLERHPDVRLRIIFTASGEESDIKTLPVAHLLAIQEKDGAAKVQQALGDWYLPAQKDYELFSSKYPMNGEVAKQKEKIQAMHQWCNVMKIRATPMIFIDGQELPDSYRIDELKSLL